MKKIILFISLLTLEIGSSAILAQSSGVLDAHTANTRFAVFKDYIDISYSLWDDIKHKAYSNSLQLTKELETELKQGRYKWNVAFHDMPYCYLFDEDDSWTIRAFRTIDLSDPENAYFTRGPCRILNFKQDDKSITHDTVYYEHESFKSVVSKDLQKGYLTAYQKIWFDYDTSFNVLDTLDALWSHTAFLKIKEDWHYEKSRGKFICHPIGLALMDENGKELVWFYYPELKLTLQNEFLTASRLYPQRQWSKVFEDHLYKTHTITTDNHRNYQNSTIEARFYNDYNVHRNDYRSLLNIEIINEHVANNYKNYAGEINDTLFDGRIIKGMLVNGIKQGEWKTFFQDGKSNLTFSYTNNVINGSYTEKNKDGVLTEKGEFHFGLREGLWNSYFENGKKLALRNYRNGWLDGKQETWYESGQNHLRYHYENFELNGLFKRWDSDGILIESGQFNKGYINGRWEMNLKIAQLYQDIILNNPNLNWGFPIEALEDGYLSYSIELEQYEDRKYCSWGICVKRLNISDID